MKSLFDDRYPDARPPHPTPGDRLGRSYGSGQIYDDAHYAVIVTGELGVAPAHVTALFHADDDTAMAVNDDHEVLLVCRGRVVHAAEGHYPESASLSWFRGGFAQTCPRLLQPERIIEGTPAYIKERTGRVVASVADSVAAAYASEREAELLQWRVGEPVMRRCTRHFDQDGRLLEYSESTILPNRWSTYQYDV